MNAHVQLPLFWIRYLLILIPAIATVYLSPIDSYAAYTFATLLYLLLVRFREIQAPPRMQWLFVVAELLFIYWLYAHYRGILFLLFHSVLTSLFQQPLRFRGLLAGLGFAAMVGSIGAADADIQWVAPIMYFSLALLLIFGQRMTVNKEELERLYDEQRRRHYQLEEARQTIVEYAQKVENLAQVEERNRIAREIHDDLGHKLIRLKMMVEAAIQIFPVQADKGMQIICHVRDQLSETMETMRATLRKLKPDEAIVRSYSLDKLIDDLGKQSGIRITYEIKGMPCPLYPSCEVVLYRNAQEAITNAIRHGKASEVALTLTYETSRIVLEVSNNGEIPSSIERKGLGLSGMEERTRLLGGELLVGYSDRFTITTVIPLQRVR